MANIRLYEIDRQYIDYLSRIEPHLFHNKTDAQVNERKYIGVVLAVGSHEYFAPLSSFKPKHVQMKETADFIKVGRYAVINLNNMFPVPSGIATYIDFSRVPDPKYKSLLLAEYRIIKSMQDKILKSAQLVYKHKAENGNSTSLARRCNNFLLLEDACDAYRKP